MVTAPPLTSARDTSAAAVVGSTQSYMATNADGVVWEHGSKLTEEASRHSSRLPVDAERDSVGGLSDHA